MNEISTVMGTANWIGIFSMILIILSFYCTLTFFQSLKSGNEDMTRRYKLAAVLSLALGLLIPVFYNLYMINKMMQ